MIPFELKISVLNKKPHLPLKKGREYHIKSDFPLIHEKIEDISPSLGKSGFHSDLFEGC